METSPEQSRVEPSCPAQASPVWFSRAHRRQYVNTHTHTHDCSRCRHIISASAHAQPLPIQPPLCLSLNCLHYNCGRYFPRCCCCCCCLAACLRPLVAVALQLQFVCFCNYLFSNFSLACASDFNSLFEGATPLQRCQLKL